MSGVRPCRATETLSGNVGGHRAQVPQLVRNLLSPRRMAVQIVIVGGANADYLVRGMRLPAPGETVSGELFQEAAGGKGANQAAGVARLGSSVALVARLGTDSRGDALRPALEQDGVDTSHVTRDRERPSGVALIAVDHAGEKQIIVAPGANAALSESDVDAARTSIALARVVVTGLEVPLPAVSAALRLGKAAGAKTILDPAPAMPLSEEVLRLVDVIRPNAAEAEALTNVKVTSSHSAAHCARILIARGVGTAIVPAGAEGDLLVTREEQHLLPRLSVRSVDATGAGDAFIAGLAVALAEGRSIVDAASFGHAAAAFSTTRVGARGGLPRREDLAPLLAERVSVTSDPR
jgi:ribokinase